MNDSTRGIHGRPALGASGLALLLLAAALLLGTAAFADGGPAEDDSTAAPSSPAAPEAPAEPAAPALEAPAPSAPAENPYTAPIATTRKVKLNASDDNVVRSGPGDRYAIAGVYPKNTVFPVIAKSGDWYNVRLSDTETGWIHASLCFEFDDMSDLEFKPNPKLYSRTGSYMLTGYAGAYAFDRKSNSFVTGGRIGYYIFDRLQAEGGVAWTRVRRPAEIVESLFDLSLEAEDFHMLFYHLVMTYELLPGRQMVPYVTGGVGSAIMRGETEASFNVGAGTMLYLSKRTAVRWEVRSYRFKSGSDDARVDNNNVEFTMGTTLLF
jgi:outer membrane beta-barrel protein